jgi:hypothetical protein
LSDFRERADAFLAASKRLVGEAQWSSMPGSLEQRAFFRVEADAARLPIGRLELIAYPTTEHRGFSLLLNYPLPILRLNNDTEDHFHDNAYPLQGVPRRVHGSRIYLWSDNRLVFQPQVHHLPLARPLPRSLQSWENALRHLCGEAHIDLTGFVLPAYPRRMTLFGA